MSLLFKSYNRPLGQLVDKASSMIRDWMSPLSSLLVNAYVFVVPKVQFDSSGKRSARTHRSSFFKSVHTDIGLCYRRPLPSPQNIGLGSLWDPISSTFVSDLSQIYWALSSILISNIGRDTPGSCLVHHTDPQFQTGDAVWGSLGLRIK